jgi:hypothetical protein
METFILQDFVTIRGDKTISSITQSVECWLDLASYQDVVAYLDVREFSVGGGNNVTMGYQTSPTRDDALFTTMTGVAGPTPINLALGVTVTPMVMGGPIFASLARYLRWQLGVTGVPNAAWDATFRVFIAANLMPRHKRGAYPMRPGMNGGSVPLHVQGGPYGVRTGTQQGAQRGVPVGVQPSSVPLHLRGAAVAYQGTSTTAAGLRRP